MAHMLVVAVSLLASVTVVMVMAVVMVPVPVMVITLATAVAMMAIRVVRVGAIFIRFVQRALAILATILIWAVIITESM